MRVGKPDRERIADYDVLQYDESMCCEICTRVGMHEEYYMADGENIDRVMEEAVD